MWGRRPSRRRRTVSQASEWRPPRQTVRLPNGRLVPAPARGGQARGDGFAGQWGARVAGRLTERASDTPLPEIRGRDRIGGDQHADWRRRPDGYLFASDPWLTGEQDGPRMSDPIDAEADEWDDVDWGDR